MATEVTAADFTNSNGIIAVLCGAEGDLPVDFALHPRVKPINALNLTAATIAGEIPANTRAVIVTGKPIPTRLFGQIKDVLRRRHLGYMARTSKMAVEQTLRDLLPDKPSTFTNAMPLPTIESIRAAEAAREHPIEAAPIEATPQPVAAVVTTPRAIAPKGSVQTLITTHSPALLKEDPQMPQAEMGRRLFRIAQSEGIPTNFDSIVQGVRVWKRKHGVGERPPSATPIDTRARMTIDTAIEALRAQIDQLEAIKVYYAGLETENAQLKARNRKITEVFDAFKEELQG